MKRPDTLEISTLRQPAALPGRARPERLAAVRSLDLALAGLLLGVLILGIWHLDRYPRSWFDEGSYLETAQNLVDNGTYAATSADGTRDFAPVVAVGPTVILPTAASLAVGGRSSLEAARIVPVIYLLFATALLYIVARALFGRRSALLALLMACSLPSLDWIVTGRQVLGEIPAVAFLLLGGIVAARQGGRQTAFIAGIVFGLTMITKGQYLLVLPAAMVAVAALDRSGPRRHPLDWYLTLIVTAMTTYLLWIASLLVIVGEGDVVENFR
ncbi:MAG: ArnT family glycosyltransferase, partial [Geminicoccales bacterium]